MCQCCIIKYMWLSHFNKNWYVVRTSGNPNNWSPRFGYTFCTSSQKCRASAAPVLSHATPCTRRELAQGLVQKCRRTGAARRQIEGRSAGGASCTGKSSARVLHRLNWCRKCSQIEETKSWLANGKKKSADTFHNTASCLFLLPTPFVTADSYTIA